MRRATLADVAAGVFLLALVMLLVRPSSLAPQFVTGFGEALSGLVTYAVTG
jgi:hypothetical protein